jgi:nucleoside-diphosphate-sugar epimerase
MAELAGKTTILVVGATGATGRLLVQQLLDRGTTVRAIVRSPGGLPAAVRDHGQCEIVQANVLDLSDAELQEHVRGCDGIASCLGHTMSFHGLFGPPWRLVTRAVRRLCAAAQANAPATPVRFVLMNSTGVRNRDLDEPTSFAHRCVIGLLRLLVPPHADNEQAAEVLRREIGPAHAAIEWVAVRPDGLTDEEEVTAYDLHPSPARSAIFDAGKTSRINVGHFMARLLTEDELWETWKGRMPVIYDRS